MEEINLYQEAEADEDDLEESLFRESSVNTTASSEDDEAAVKKSVDEGLKYDQILRRCQRSGCLEVKVNSLYSMMRPRRRKACLYRGQLILYSNKEAKAENIIEMADAVVKSHPKKRDRFSVKTNTHKNQTHEVRRASFLLHAVRML